MDNYWSETTKIFFLMNETKDLQTIILQTRELGIGYKINRRIHILHDRLNLLMHRGDLVCVIGPNGSGKSTLIRTIGGLQSALQGNITIYGRPLSDLKLPDKSKLLSIVLTEKTAVENMTVHEIVGLGRYAETNWFGSLKENDLHIIRSSLKMVGLNDYENRYYGTLSDGEKQRTFIAKALASDAPLMMLDEPTAHLDVPNRVEIMILLRRLTREKHRSVMVSTHDLDLALQLADEIWLLEKDNVILCCTPEEAVSSGIINDCFGSRSIQFHPEHGRFIINTKPKGSVFVTGKGLYYDMTLKALERIGFKVESEKTDISVRVDNQIWKVNFGAEWYEADKLSEVIRLIRSFGENVKT
jgi:iron complex transport system ATP-binding protein